VTNALDNTVSVVNVALCNAQVTSGCNQTPPTVSVGSFPIALFADEMNHTVYVANQGPTLNGTTYSMIDTTVCNASNLAGCASLSPPTVTVGTAPSDVDVNQTTHTVYAAILGGVGVFDANTCNAKVLSGCGKIGLLTGDPTVSSPPRLIVRTTRSTRQITTTRPPRSMGEPATRVTCRDVPQRSAATLS
jgi:DNA-binding beta-propeller fold protein YncE